MSKGGNLLLNVGPTGRGELDHRARERLEGMGRWMRQNGRSIYGCGPAPEEFSCPRDCRFTFNPETKRLYLHILAWPLKAIHLEGMKGRIAYAQFLHDASEVLVREGGAKHGTGSPDDLTLEIPVVKPNVDVPVIEMFLK